MSQWAEISQQLADRSIRFVVLVFPPVLRAVQMFLLILWQYYVLWMVMMMKTLMMCSMMLVEPMMMIWCQLWCMTDDGSWWWCTMMIDDGNYDVWRWWCTMMIGDVWRMMDHDDNVWWWWSWLWPGWLLNDAFGAMICVESMFHVHDDSYLDDRDTWLLQQMHFILE